jgi:chromosome segregation ATPase
MENDDITVRVLIDIRDRLDQTNVRLETMTADLSQRIDDLNHDLGERIDRTNDRITSLELRTATEMTAVATAVQDVSRLLNDRFDLRDRVERVERGLEDLRKKVG